MRIMMRHTKQTVTMSIIDGMCLLHLKMASEPWRRAVEAASSLASSPRRAHVEAVASS